MTYVFFLYFLVFLVCFLFYVKLLWLYQSPTLLLLSVLLLVVVGFFCCCWFVCLVHFSLHGLSFCPFALELQVEFFSNSEMSRINSRTLICFLYQISDSWKCELNLLTFMWMSYICILSLFSLCLLLFAFSWINKAFQSSLFFSLYWFGNHPFYSYVFSCHLRSFTAYTELTFC